VDKRQRNIVIVWAVLLLLVLPLFSYLMAWMIGA
jgi:hypothetical protein